MFGDERDLRLPKPKGADPETLSGDSSHENIDPVCLH